MYDLLCQSQVINSNINKCTNTSYQCNCLCTLRQVGLTLYILIIVFYRSQLKEEKKLPHTIIYIDLVKGVFAN